MEFSSWFQSAIQRRLDRVGAWVEHHPDLKSFRDEESRALEEFMTGLDPAQLACFMEWEDKHNLKLGLENERLYMQGMRDGAQLLLALLSDPLAAVPPAGTKEEKAASAQTEREERW